ncbi:MAG TPA: hypothetical protein VFB76_16785, partial [Candidatus Angelobacter sp.]|nr:hypothetical protein [Candidatus Angelobacter sp.]
GKAAKLVLAIVIPALAGAQVPQQAKPSPQVPSAAPAANSNAAVTPTQRTSPAVSPRYVTSENFYRPSAKPQTAIPAPPVMRPVQPMVAPRPNTAVPLQPTTIAAVPQVQAPQAAHPVTTSALVDYASGQLTVVSDDAPLGYVLKEIAAKTGAILDVAPELQNERVAARLGPASVREILTRLLDSPQIDYIVLGTGDEPGSLQRIVVRARGRAGQIAMAGTRQPQANPVQENFEQQPQTMQPQIGMNGPMNAAQTQRMENWQKAREEMRLAEIKKQAQERENEQNNPSFPDPPAIENNQPVDPPQNPQTENPPQL